jgi:hypothetical protein
MNKLFFLTLTTISFLLLTGCGSTDIRPVAGTIDAPLPADSAPADVVQAVDKANRFHQHDILSDDEHNISVSSLDEVDTTSTQGYGIVVTNGNVSTTLLNIRNTRQPQACYDAATASLWLTSSAMEGTGVQVERLYLICFDADGKAFVAYVIDPYAVQQEICRRLCYSIDGQTVSFFDGHTLLCTATNTISDMGGFDSDYPVWVGEQLCYDLSTGSPRLCITPGLNFTTGLVLTYDDMPVLTAPVSVDTGSTQSFSIGGLEVK